MRNLNDNFIVLISKVSNAGSVEQYRPIASGNFFFSKIITKIPVDILGSIADKIISP